MTTIHVAMNDGVAVVNRSNGGWHLETRLEGTPMQCVAADPQRPQRVLAGTAGRGLWRSDDGGRTWRGPAQRAGASDGIRFGDVTAVAASPLERAAGGDGGVVYAGTEPSTLFRSDDGGRTWQELPALSQLPSAPTWSFPPKPGTHHVRWIQPDPVAAERVFVAIEQGGVMRSCDGGRTFEDRQPGGPRDAHTLAAHGLAPGRVYAPAADGMGIPGKALVESDDAGASWQLAGQGIRHAYGWSVAVDPGDPETVLYSGAHTPRQAHDPAVADSTMYRRTAGAPWQEVRDGLPEPQGTVIYVLAANAAEPGVFYAASNKGLFRSPDAGRSWERLGVAWPERYLRQHVQGLAVVEAG